MEDAQGADPSGRTEFGGDDAFRFRHLLIRDAAYQSMSKSVRAELHERLAGWLDRVSNDRPTEYEEIIGYHFEQSHRFRTEVGPLDEHGAEVGPLDEHGVEVGRRAADRLGAAGDRQVELRATIGRSFLRMRTDPDGSTAEAHVAVETALPVFESVGDHKATEVKYQPPGAS